MVLNLYIYIRQFLLRRNMRRRGHVGNINIDHDNYRLSLKVRVLVCPMCLFQKLNDVSNVLYSCQVRMQGQDKAFEDMRSLSGGEKSFTTVAFVLSLGEIALDCIYFLNPFFASGAPHS